jgi:hypothetical protein
MARRCTIELQNPDGTWKRLSTADTNTMMKALVEAKTSNPNQQVRARRRMKILDVM